MSSTYEIHKAVDEAFRCRGEHSCYSGADDMSECTCLKEMQAVMPGKISVIDSCEANKAKACIEELRDMFLGQLPTDVREEMAVLAKYGFERKK